MDEDGCYTEGAGRALQGLPVLSKGSEAVMTLLSADILHSEQLVHSYPYDWRTKQPVILRASWQWFIDTNAIKQKAIVSCTLELFTFLRMPAKLQNATISSSRLSVYLFAHLSVWINSAPTRQTFVKLDIWVFFKNLSRKFKFH